MFAVLLSNAEQPVSAMTLSATVDVQATLRNAAAEFRGMGMLHHYQPRRGSSVSGYVLAVSADGLSAVQDEGVAEGEGGVVRAQFSSPAPFLGR
ncbi:hypothetical protein [Mycobacterium sp. IS-3022]|uniref:hypothetical protein n=1 Tax=Mycobacterium sp. IS-3022 TaxID=1772277 RepID=UPI0015601FA8|nr:hypothetical protein [Mycobacterium sp. IS-3022]